MEVTGRPPGALADELTGSRWQVDLVGVEVATLQAARDAFLAEDEVLVQRMTKNGVREFDARAAVISLRSEDGRLTMILAHETPLVRPDDVLAALRAASPESCSHGGADPDPARPGQARPRIRSHQ